MRRPKVWLIAVGVLLVVVLLVGQIVYSLWQFGLCYPEVSSSWWYCFQHAW